MHGEGGFTTVDARSAKGKLSTFPEQTCRRRHRSKRRVEREIARQEKAEAKGPQIESLSAAHKLGGGVLVFSAINGDIPNRGLLMHDINMHGVTYMQQISEKNGPGLHIEPGIWAHVPATSERSLCE